MMRFPILSALLFAAGITVAKQAPTQLDIPRQPRGPATAERVAPPRGGDAPTNR